MVANATMTYFPQRSSPALGDGHGLGNGHGHMSVSSTISHSTSSSFSSSSSSSSSSSAASSSSSDADGALIARAERGLRRLAVARAVDDGMVSEAAAALRELRNRVRYAQTQRYGVHEQVRALGRQAARVEDQQRRVDQDIIDVSIRRGDTLMAREGLARDVAVARRSLDNDDSDLNLAMMDPDDSRDRDTSYSKTRTDSDELEKLKDAMRREALMLRETESQLVDVVDEISRIRKRRADLQRQVDDVEQEW